MGFWIHMVCLQMQGNDLHLETNEIFMQIQIKLIYMCQVWFEYSSTGIKPNSNEECSHRKDNELQNIRNNCKI